MPRFGWFPRRFVRPGLVAAFLLTPLAAVSLALAGCRATLLDCTPLLNDEIHYWCEIASFTRAGFNGGYFAPNEHPAPLSFFHFGPHGPAFPVLYGSLGKVFGWHRTSAPVFNLLALLAGAGFWVWRCRPDNRRLAAGILLLATFWPLLMYVPCTMQESLHLALAFVLAALAHPLVNGAAKPAATDAITASEPARPAPPLAPFLTAVAVVSLFRFTWLLVLLPWACIATAGRPWRTRAILVLAIAGLIPAVFFLSRLTSAPYPNYATKLVAVARETPSHAYAEFKQRTQASLDRFTSPTIGETLEILQHYEVIGLIVAAGLAILRPGGRNTRPHAFAALNLLLVAGLMIAFYDVGEFREYRVIAPHLLLCLLVLLSGAGYRWAVGVAYANLLFVLPFFNYFESTNRDRFIIQSAAIDADREKLARYLAYDPAKPAWDNTVLISVRNYVHQMVALPPGMGLSFVLEQKDAEAMTYPPKSRYVFTRGIQFGKAFPGPVHLRPLVDTDMGTLYLNLDSLSPDEARAAGPPTR